jgi:hypothetical protein
MWCVFLAAPLGAGAETVSFASTLPGIELVAERVYWSVDDEVVDCPEPFEDVRICVRLSNMGSDSAPRKPIHVKVFVDDEFIGKLVQPKSQPLASGESVDLCMSEGGRYAEASHPVRVQFDSRDYVAELNEDNDVETVLNVGAACAGASCGDGICAPEETQATCAIDCGAGPLLTDGYPHALFYRGKTEKQSSDENWQIEHTALMGIIGKAQDERVLDREKNVEPFTTFKLNNPEQYVFLHYNGNFREPGYRRGKFFAGHWLYHPAVEIVRDVAAEDTTIYVSDTSGFNATPSKEDDIALCERDPEGKPDWNACEQVSLIRILDIERIEIRRAQYGTKRRVFGAHNAFASAHANARRRGVSAWHYNYSTLAPRDREGRSTGEVLAEDLASLFIENGELSEWDGLVFDFLPFAKSTSRPLDFDGDGIADKGRVDGLNTYGLGVFEFSQHLREALPEKLIVADGQATLSQRSFGIFNGMESEGWPLQFDPTIRDWSGGFNRLAYWARFALPPVFNIINHKYAYAYVGLEEGIRFNTSRLAMAAAVFTDSAFGSLMRPPGRPEGFELVHIWDEVFKGVEKEAGWLGRPLAPSTRLAIQQPPLWANYPEGVSPHMLPRVDGAESGWANGVLTIEATQPRSDVPAFVLRDLPIDGPDLVVTMVAWGEPWGEYPADIPRRAWVKVAGTDQEFWTFIGPHPFESVFYFKDLTTSSVDLEVRLENKSPIYISNLRAYAHPDVIYREFENGIVLANPSSGPYTFDLASLTNGEARAPHLEVFENGGLWNIRDRDTGYVFLGRHAPAYFTDSELNPRGAKQVRKVGDLALDGLLELHWEDLPSSKGSDFNDVVVKVERDDHRLHVGFVDEEAGLRSSLGWYDRASGDAGILIANVDKVTNPGLADFTATLVLSTEQLRHLGLFLIPGGYDLNRSALERPQASKKGYRRLQATKAQDLETNNGECVGRSVTLPSMDALFLVRDDSCD